MDFLLIPIILLPLIANISVKSAYSKYSDIKSETDLKGKDIARIILDSNGLDNVEIIPTKGLLSDHYNPKTKTIALSEEIYNSSSIAAISVAAHEVGHAIQDKDAYTFMRFRSAMVPVVNISSRLSTLFIIIGLMTEIVNLYFIGIILISLGLLFQLITLPVEFNASNRSKKQLEKLNMLSKEDLSGTDKMLKAAAFTYVASFLAMTAQIIRLIGLNNRN